MKKGLIALVLIAGLLAVSCSSHTFVVGSGAHFGQSETARQWYILYGLVPLNHVDTQAMAGGNPNYVIKAETKPIDIIIGIPASMITVSSRTVTVEK